MFRPTTVAVQQGSGTPTHAAYPGTIYYDVDTGVPHRNVDGGTTWHCASVGVVAPRCLNTGGRGAVATTDGTNAIPIVTEIYVAELFVPCAIPVTGISLFNGSAVGSDKVKLALFSAAGRLLTATAVAGTTCVGTDSYQRVPLTAPAMVYGPQSVFVAAIFNGTTVRFNAHAFGDFGAGKLTGHVFATAFDTTALTGLTMPSTFAADLGPIASLY